MMGDDHDHLTIERMAWARKVLVEVLRLFHQAAREIDEQSVRENVLSAMMGVATATFREAAVRAQNVDPYLVEVIASMELASNAQRETDEHLRHEELVRALIQKRAEGQVPS